MIYVKFHNLLLKDNNLAQLAIEIFCHRVAKFVASYMIYFNKLDALVFTGGIGENATNIRENIIAKLTNLGFEIDHQKTLILRHS